MSEIDQHSADDTENKDRDQSDRHDPNSFLAHDCSSFVMIFRMLFSTLLRGSINS